MHEHPHGHGHPAEQHARQQQGHRDEGESHVLVHGAHGATGQVDGGGEHQQVVAHQGDVRGLDRHGRAGRAHRDADVGGGQRRRVVHAVTHHCHDMTVPLQPGHDLQFVFWQQL